jgi:hypothetical protein
MKNDIELLLTDIDKCVQKIADIMVYEAPEFSDEIMSELSYIRCTTHELRNFKLDQLLVEEES